jgi:hypothetical protein
MSMVDKSKETTPRVFFIAMGVLFILLQIAFHPSYLQYFPGFEKFNWVHHAHGAIMVSWMMMLVVQPYLVHTGRYKTHRLVGRISYVTAPLMIISMYLATRQNYLTTVDKVPFKDVAYIQALNFGTLLTFCLFYTLAILNKKQVYKHKRYMIGTAFIMIMAIVSRLLQHSFGTAIEPYDYFIPLYLGVGLSALLLANDVMKKTNPYPYVLVTVVILLNTLVFHARYTEWWQGAVRWVGDHAFY